MQITTAGHPGKNALNENDRRFLRMIEERQQKKAASEKRRNRRIEHPRPYQAGVDSPRRFHVYSALPAGKCRGMGCGNTSMEPK